MGIGHQALAVFEETVEKNIFHNLNSVMEMGAQIIDVHYQERAKDLIKKHSNNNNAKISAKDFYHAIGFKEYYSIDANGKHGSIVYDLNHNLQKYYNFDKKFDLVTNFGTSEHLFNQKNFFESMHNCTNVNGLMFHLLPFEGYLNHGYFNYQPSYFYDLALFNDYEIVGFWYFSERPLKNFKYYYGKNYKPLKYSNKLFNYLDKLSDENKLPGSPSTNHSSLGVMYKKKNNSEFKDPFQSQWVKENKLKNYSKGNSNSNEILDINYNVDHKKQVDELLGRGYWKIKIKNLIYNRKYRIKILKLILNRFGLKFEIKEIKKYWLD